MALGGSPGALRALGKALRGSPGALNKLVRSSGLLGARLRASYFLQRSPRAVQPPLCGARGVSAWAPLRLGPVLRTLGQGPWLSGLILTASGRSCLLKLVGGPLAKDHPVPSGLAWPGAVAVLLLVGGGRPGLAKARAPAGPRGPWLINQGSPKSLILSLLSLSGQAPISRNASLPRGRRPRCQRRRLPNKGPRAL